MSLRYRQRKCDVQITVQGRVSVQQINGWGKLAKQLYPSSAAVLLCFYQHGAQRLAMFKMAMAIETYSSESDTSESGTMIAMTVGRTDS